MKLTPIDIQQQQFRRSLRGFDVREVNNFLELVAQQMGELTRANSVLRTELRQTQRDLDEHCDREATLKEAMLTAQRAIDEIREQAEKQADLIVNAADLRAEKMLHSAHKRANGILEDIQDLKHQRARALAELRGVINTHQKLLDVHEDKQKDQASQLEDASITVLERVRPPPPPRLEQLTGTGGQGS